MKIVLIARNTLYSSPGGDTVQICSTAKYLRKLGVEVDILLASDCINYTAYDLIHFFNIIRPDDILPHINHCIPFVISTVFVEYSEFEKSNKEGFKSIIFQTLSSGQIEFLKVIARWFKNGDKIQSKYYLLHGHKASIRHIVSLAKALLPNSHSEYNRLYNYTKLKVNYKKIVNFRKYSARKF